MDNIDNFPNINCILTDMNKYVNKQSFSTEEMKGLNNGCYLLLTFLFDNQMPSINEKEREFMTTLKERLEYLGNACFPHPSFQNSSTDWLNLINANHSVGSDAVCLMIKTAYAGICHEMNQTPIA